MTDPSQSDSGAQRTRESDPLLMTVQRQLHREAQTMCGPGRQWGAPYIDESPSSCSAACSWPSAILAFSWSYCSRRGSTKASPATGTMKPTILAALGPGWGCAGRNGARSRRCRARSLSSGGMKGCLFAIPGRCEAYCRRCLSCLHLQSISLLRHWLQAPHWLSPTACWPTDGVASPSC